MRWDNIYLAGTGTYLPEQVETVDDAIAAGRYTQEKKELNGYRAVRTAAAGETGPIMAVHAAREAVQRSGHHPDDFGVLVHTYVGHQGLEVWTPASYIQQEAIPGSINCSPMEVKQGCNGFLAGIEMAASYIAASPDSPAALVTGGDAFRLPYIDRWCSHEQNVDGDGAGAFVLSTRGGFARVRSTVSISDSTLEVMGRGSRQWTDGPFADGKPLALDGSMRDFMEDTGADLDEIVARISNGVQTSVKRALAEADAEMSDIRFFLHQQLAEPIAVYGLYELLGVDRSSTTFDWGKDIGMVGTVDMALALDHVIATRQPQAGDLVLLQSAAAGYTWSAIVLEFTETPSWAG